MKHCLVAIWVVLATGAWAGCPNDFAELATKPSDAPFPIEAQSESHSVAERAPEFVTLARDVFRATSIDREIASHGDRTYREALEWILNARKEQAQRLLDEAAKLQRAHPHEYLAVAALHRLAEKIRPGEHEVETLEHQLNARSNDGRPIGARLVSDQIAGGDSDLSTAHAVVRGNVGEAIGGFMVEDFQQVGLVVMRIPGAYERIIAAEPDRGRAESLYRSEMDLVFKNGAAWGEVKMHPYLTLEELNQPKASGKKSILEQAQDHAELGRIFHKEIHEIFINGIAPDAARELEDLGIIVHGTLPEPPPYED